MRIASWNINSLRARLEHVRRWIGQEQPDILALQETKLADAQFPHEALAELGYESAFVGQPSYNGVAILSKGLAVTDVQRGIPRFDDVQQRAIALTVGDLRIINLYVVNGESVGSDKFEYKLRWIAAAKTWLKREAKKCPRLIVLGDFNIAPEDRDVYKPERWREKIMCSTPERKALAGILGIGLHDSLRLFHEEAGLHTWWDYRLLAFQRGWGLRIDLALVSDAVRMLCVDAGIDRDPRSWERPCADLARYRRRQPKASFILTIGHRVTSSPYPGTVEPCRYRPMGPCAVVPVASASSAGRNRGRS
jgi:exodeoxyribonuclease-3